MNIGRIRAGYHSPVGAIPLLDQSVGASPRSFIVADSPDIIRGDRRYTRETIAVQSRIGAGYNRPGAAIPLLDQSIFVVIRTQMAFCFVNMSLS